MSWLAMIDWKQFGLTTAGSTVALFAIAFILKKWFIARITESIKHEYAKELESHKNTLRSQTDTEINRLNGNIAIEVEKAKLKLSFYSEKQFELYNELWLNLCDLKNTMNRLWDSIHEDDLWEFQRQLLKVDDMLERNGLLIEQQHYDELRMIINDFGNYRLGKETLREMRQEQGVSEKFGDTQVQNLVNNNRQLRQKLVEYLPHMKMCLRNQINGNYDRLDGGS